MKLLAPINSLDSCKAQIEAGADEMYVGMRSSLFKKFNFSARYQINEAGAYIMPDQSELKEIVQYSHSKGKIVTFAANIQYISDDPKHGVNLEREYLQYVSDGLDCNVDNIIVSDIGLCRAIEKNGLQTNIHISTILDTISRSQLMFLKELGAKRAVLSFQVRNQEIKQLAQRKPIELELFGFGGCSFSTQCNLGHGLGMGVICRNQYGCNGQPVGDVLNFTRMCSLCSIKNFADWCIDTVKLIGRESYYKQITPITSLFHEIIHIAHNTTVQEFANTIQDHIPVWWKKSICNKGQCKYTTESERYYI